MAVFALAIMTRPEFWQALRRTAFANCRANRRVKRLQFKQLSTGCGDGHQPPINNRCLISTIGGGFIGSGIWPVCGVFNQLQQSRRLALQQHRHILAQKGTQYTFGMGFILQRIDMAFASRTISPS
jgi:hypothetical protein